MTAAATPAATPAARPRRFARGLATGVACLLVVAGAGCGQDDDGRFDARVSGVREAIDTGDRDAALAELDALALDGLAAHDAGDLSDEELSQLAQRIQTSRELLDQVLPPAASATTAPSSEADGGDDDAAGNETGERDDHHDRPGKGKGRGNKDE